MPETAEQRLGRRGEALAKSYLLAGGYRLIEHNCRFGHREIDLIAWRSPDQLVFIEVKTRFKTAASLTDNPLPFRQIINLKRAIRSYCRQHRLSVAMASLDLIVVLADRAAGRATLRHYRNII
ncbi:MAG: YraN family protein [Patescibacteria group bacterium]